MGLTLGTKFIKEGYQKTIVLWVVAIVFWFFGSPEVRVLRLIKIPLYSLEPL